MKLRDIMTTPVLTFGRYEPASDALAFMRDAGVRHAVVLSGTQILGVISERDLGGPHGGRLRVGRNVGELMQGEPVLAEPETSLAQAAELLRDERIGCLPVVERGRLLGIVTRSDVLAAIAERRAPAA